MFKHHRPALEFHAGEVKSSPTVIINASSPAKPAAAAPSGNPVAEAAAQVQAGNGAPTVAKDQNNATTQALPTATSGKKPLAPFVDPFDDPTAQTYTPEDRSIKPYKAELKTQQNEFNTWLKGQPKDVQDQLAAKGVTALKPDGLEGPLTRGAQHARGQVEAAKVAKAAAEQAEAAKAAAEEAECVAAGEEAECIAAGEAADGAAGEAAGGAAAPPAEASTEARLQAAEAKANEALRAIAQDRFDACSFDTSRGKAAADFAKAHPELMPATMAEKMNDDACNKFMSEIGADANERIATLDKMPAQTRATMLRQMGKGYETDNDKRLMGEVAASLYRNSPQTLESAPDLASQDSLGQAGRLQFLEMTKPKP